LSMNVVVSGKGVDSVVLIFSEEVVDSNSIQLSTS
jgi:hypothetical protein